MSAMIAFNCADPLSAMMGLKPQVFSRLDKKICMSGSSSTTRIVIFSAPQDKRHLCPIDVNEKTA
jgi:hypothetical protein